MSKFRVSRFLKRDLVARVSFLNDKGIIQNSRKFFEFYPSDNQESEGWYETTDEVLLASLKEQTEQLPYSPPSYHYLTKMVDGSTGWSLVQNSNTVVGSSKEELLKQYPEYEDFIVQEPLNVVSFKPQGEKNKRFTPSRKKGFVIKEHARKNY